MLLIGAAGPASSAAPSTQKVAAERFFRALYGCGSDAALEIEQLAGPDVRVSYPIFQTIFGQQVLRGQVAVQGFAEHFCRKWADPSITVHEAVEEGNRVVLLWGFAATDQQAPDPQTAGGSWGGISILRFDSAGRVVEEVGEESSPGPVARLASDAEPPR
jgi:hypothetical protein